MTNGFYPRALVKNIPPGANDPAIKPRIAVLHVAVSNADSLHDYFNGPSGGIESHFYVRFDGTVEQYRSIYFQADAQLDANDFAVGIETAGMGDGTWTDAQLAAIKQLLTWLHTEAGIPLEVCTAWDGHGVGYHTMFGAPGHWTPVAKTCPGPKRIEQFHAALVPWMAEASKPPVAYLKLQHSSMQFSDSRAQQRADADEVFSVGSDVITGTEAGAVEFISILTDAATAHGYLFRASKRGEWTAIRADLGVVRRSGLVPVLPGQPGPARLGGHAPRGIFWVEVQIPDVGLVTFSTGHYLTKGRSPLTPRGRQNRRYIKALGVFALEHGRGSRLVFFGADTNMNDRTSDVFAGTPLTTAWDELDEHPSTHGPHGSTLDVIASYNLDGRVKAVSARVLADLGLNTDHQTIVAKYAIKPTTRKA